MMFDFCSTGRWVREQQRFCRQDHSGGAEAALEGTKFKESFLDWVEVVPVAKAFDCHDIGAIGVDGQHRAATYGVVAHQNSTGTASLHIAGAFDAAQILRIPQKIDEQCVGFDQCVGFFAIERHRDIMRG